MSKSKILLQLFFCLLVFPSARIDGQTIKTTVYDEIIIANQTSDVVKTSRHIFMLLDEKNFSRKNIEEIFAKYSKLYSESDILVIYAYTDKEMLQRLIRFENSSWIFEFSKDEEGREAAKKFYEKYYPLPKGYFRAVYNRYGSFELFDYSPQKESSVMIRVTLKTQLRRLLKMQPQDAIFEAVKSNDYQGISALIEKGVDLNINDEHNYTPMLWASSKGTAETVNLLIKAGVDVNYQNTFGFTALMLAQYDIEILNLLIKNGAKINTQDKYGNTAVYYAINDENLNLLRYLIENGADTKIKNKAGISPLEFAEKKLESSNNKTEIIKILTKP